MGNEKILELREANASFFFELKLNSKERQTMKMEISEYKVLRSNAGYYIGRTYFDEELQADLPYDRASEYFRSRKQAEFDLNLYAGFWNEDN